MCRGVGWWRQQHQQTAINDKWAWIRSPFTTVAVCGARRCCPTGLAVTSCPPRIRGTAATYFFSPGPGGAKQPSEPSSATRGRWTTNTQRWQLLAVAESVAGRLTCGVPRPCPARPQRRGGHARFVLRVQTPMRATGYSAGFRPSVCVEVWCSRTWSMALRRYANGRQNCNRDTRR